MSSPLRCDFDVKWSGVAIAVVFTKGVSFIAACWAKSLGGILSIGPIFLSAVLALFALWTIIRRLMFPRVLELTDDAIIFPGGFTGRRTTRIAFGEIIRMKNTRMYPGIYMVTSKGNFEILSIRFTSIENYRAIRDVVCSKTSIVLSEDAPQAAGWDRGWVPGPIMRWSEPEDYIRYQTHLATSKPLWLRLAKAIRFFVCCFGFFFLPWLVLNYSLSAALPATNILAVLIPASLFFTMVYWLYAYHSARVTHITVFPEGFSQLSGKQVRSFDFSDFSGWAVVERQFEKSTAAQVPCRDRFSRYQRPRPIHSNFKRKKDSSIKQFKAIMGIAL